jgi:glycosyltransferase involved in cell wall biosynthesis
MNKIDGSVIITTKDKNSRLRLTLQALEMQVQKNNIEVVVVFDGCKKETIEEFDTIPLSFLPIKVILEKNLGRSGARNEGIRSSRGDVLIFLDDDRIPSPNFIEENLKKHEENCVVLSDRYEINYSEQELENIYNSRKAVYDFKGFISSAKLDFYYHLKKVFLFSSRVGWFVSREYALMLNVNSAGVRSIHSTEFFSLGGK